MLLGNYFQKKSEMYHFNRSTQALRNMASFSKGNIPQLALCNLMHPDLKNLYTKKNPDKRPGF